MTLPNALNLVKNVGDLKLMRGPMTATAHPRLGRKPRRGGGARPKMTHCGCYGYHGVMGGTLMGTLYIS